MAYRNLSHTEVTISNKAKLSGIYETKVWDKFHISWLVVRLSILLYQKAFLKTRLKRTVFNPVVELWKFIKWQNETNFMESINKLYLISQI